MKIKRKDRNRHTKWIISKFSSLLTGKVRTWTPEQLDLARQLGQLNRLLPQSDKVVVPRLRKSRAKAALSVIWAALQGIFCL